MLFSCESCPKGKQLTLNPRQEHMKITINMICYFHVILSGIQCQLFSLWTRFTWKQHTIFIVYSTIILFYSKSILVVDFINPNWRKNNHNKYDMLFSCALVWDSVLTVFPLDKIHMKTTYHIYCVQYNHPILLKINISCWFYQSKLKKKQPQ